MPNVPFLNVPFLYINGLELSNDAVNPDEIVNIALGQCRDSTDTYQIISNGVIPVNNTFNGLNGLDTGTVAANTLYHVYVISDPVTGLPTGGILSLSATQPLMPFGYSAFRLVGYHRTDGTSDFLLGKWSGNNNARLFMYDAPIATAITAGAAVTYTNVILTTFVPAQDNLPVWMKFDMTPSAASRIMSLHPFGGTGDAVSITSQVTAVHVTGNALVLTGLNAGAPTLQYKWSAGGGDAVALNVAGYQFYV